VGKISDNVTFEFLVVMNINVSDLCDVTPYSLMNRLQSFGRTLKMEESGSSENVLLTYQITQCHNLESYNLRATVSERWPQSFI